MEQYLIPAMIVILVIVLILFVMKKHEKESSANNKEKYESCAGAKLEQASFPKKGYAPPSGYKVEASLKPREYPLGFVTPQPEWENGIAGYKPNPGKFYGANNCVTDSLYPIQGLGPVYGKPLRDDCPCMEFIQPP